MTIFRITFAGEIKKAETKNIGGKTLVEVSICKKNRTKEGEPDAYSWLRIGLWEPAAFQIPKLAKGAFIGGTGELTLRSYEGKDGKATSMECRCTSFDVEVSDGAGRGESQQQAAPTPIASTRPSVPTAASHSEEIPF